MFQKLILIASIVGPSPAPDPVFKGQFGYAVDMDGNIAAVTTLPEHDQYPTPSSGTLYIYEQVAPGSWLLRGQFTSDGEDDIDWYGISVAVSGTTVVVGASRDDEFGSNAGAIYLYEKVGSSWQEVDKFAADDSDPNGDFGIAVALEGNTLIVGAWFHDIGGAAYAFEKNGGNWQQVAQFLPELLLSLALNHKRPERVEGDIYVVTSPLSNMLIY